MDPEHPRDLGFFPTFYTVEIVKEILLSAAGNAFFLHCCIAESLCGQPCAFNLSVTLLVARILTTSLTEI